MLQMKTKISITLPELPYSENASAGHFGTRFHPLGNTIPNTSTS
jgi:hypothetical protein